MEELPEAPLAEGLPELHDDDVVTLGPGTTIWRVHLPLTRHGSEWNTLRSYGPTGSRFDHHPPDPTGAGASHPGLGILYGAFTPPGAAAGYYTCLAEVFQDARVIDRHDGMPVLSAFRTLRPLALLDLRSGWPTRAQCGATLASGRRDRARDWSRAIYARYDHLEGVCYPSSVWPPGVAVALYERGADALPPSPLSRRSLLDPALRQLLEDAAALLDYKLL